MELLRKYDGEFPERGFKAFLDFIDLNEKEFWEMVNRFRQTHIETKQK